MKKISGWIYMGLSALMVLNILFVPMFSAGGGLFPEQVSMSFFEIVQFAFSDSAAWQYYLVLFSLVLVVPAIVMLVVSVFQKWILNVAAAGLSLLAWLGLMVMYGIDRGFGLLFDFSAGPIALGSWLTLVLSVAALVFGWMGKETKSSTHTQFVPVKGPEVVPAAVVPNATPVAVEKPKFCPFCGGQLKPTMTFCGHCGKKLP